MSVIGSFDVELEAATKNFTVEVLAKDLQPEIDESLIKHGGRPGSAKAF